MRKRLVIGAVAAVVIGVAAYALIPPKKGSVAWHKREYLALRYPKLSVKERLQGLWARVRGETLFRCDSGPDFFELDTHLRALEELGYLRRRVVVLTNTGFGEGIDRLIVSANQATPDGHIWRVSAASTESLCLLYPQEDNALWEKLIREADVPETK